MCMSFNKPLPSSKIFQFQNEAKSKNLSCENEFYERKNRFQINSFALRALSICQNLTSQTVPVVMTFQPDQSNPKSYARRRWFLSENPLEKADFICSLTGPAMVRPAS